MAGMDNGTPKPPINESLLLLKAVVFAAAFIGLGKFLLGGFPATIGEALVLWWIATLCFFGRLRQHALRELRQVQK
jgi:hypothetical protein